MKEFIKRNIKMIVIVIGILSLTGIVAYATGTYVFESTDVRFDNTNTEITAGDVQGALEEVFQHVTDYNDIKDQIGTYYIGQNTLANIETALATFGGTLVDNEIRNIGFAVSTESGLFHAVRYYGTIIRHNSTRYAVRVMTTAAYSDYKLVEIKGIYNNGTWTWNSLDDQIGNLDDHNAVFRGKSLGSSVTSAQWTAISSGTFDDLYVGDYWTINSVTWRIAGFDIYYGKGDTAFNTHHAVIVPDTNLTSAKMNDTATTTGGYVGSKMYTDTLPTVLTTIRNAFGTDHVLKYRALLTNSVNTSYQNRLGGISNGAGDGWSWYDAYVNLMNMVQVTGNIGFSSSAFDTGADNVQFPLFRLRPEFINKQQSMYWVRDVASSARFADVHNVGYTDYHDASHSGGVRPYFYIG